MYPTITHSYNPILLFEIQYHPGTARIIISVPHGGYLEPEGIPDRIPGCLGSSPEEKECIYKSNDSCANETLCKITTVTDAYTIELATVMADTIEEQLGDRPHLIISNLKR